MNQPVLIRKSDTEHELEIILATDILSEQMEISEPKPLTWYYWASDHANSTIAEKTLKDQAKDITDIPNFFIDRLGPKALIFWLQLLRVRMVTITHLSQDQEPPGESYEPTT